MSTSSLLWGVLFGSIGLGYVMYGRRQRLAMPFVCGVALIGLPYVVTHTVALLVTGLLLVLAPWFAQRWLR